MSDREDRLRTLLTEGRHAEAIGLYEAMPPEARDRVEAKNAYACALVMAGEAARAFALLSAIPDDRRTFNIWNNLCLAGLELERFAETRGLLAAALDAHPGNHTLLLASARCLSSLNMLEESYAAALAALDTEANDDALYAAGLAAGRLRRYDDAIGFYRRCLAEYPDHGASANNLNEIYWRVRQFSGVRDVAEARLRSPTNRAQYRRYFGAACAPWSGGPLAGRRLHVIADQGVGDQIMFAQFPGRLAAFEPARVIVHLEHRLVPLFREGFRGDIEIAFEPFGASIECGPTDAKVPLSSLPNYLVRSAADFPRKPFLDLQPGTGDFRGGDARPVFGLGWWSAGLASEARSLEIDELAAALRTVEARFLSLQYRPADAGIERLKALLGDRLIVAEGLDCTNDFTGVAQACMGLDGVLTIPQALVHVAGAVGARVGIVLPQSPSWRYDSPDETMLWYGDHVRLIECDGRGSLANRIAPFLRGQAG